MSKIAILCEKASYKLCYVSRFDGGAWFADCEPTEVWGDDHDDSPYEHNCGDPYNYRYVNWPENKEQIPVDFLILQYAGVRYETPAEKAWGGNSHYSVEMINHKHTAWLAPDSHLTNHPPIFAGTTAQEFIDIIIAAGGIVLLPHTLIGKVMVVEYVEDGTD